MVHNREGVSAPGATACPATWGRAMSQTWTQAVMLLNLAETQVSSAWSQAWTRLNCAALQTPSYHKLNPTDTGANADLGQAHFAGTAQNAVMLPCR